MATPLLGTKLYAPPLRSSCVSRRRLADRLRAGLHGKLTLVVAPAGFGKTTLLSEALSGLPLAWVSLDAGDNDATRFWHYVLAALNRLAPGLADTTLALLQAPRPQPPDVIVTSLLNALNDLDVDAALILDDYQVIDAAPIHEGLAFLLEHLSPRLHIVIATRADPPLRLSRLRARAELTELRAADLRFTSDEAASFLTDVMGLPVSPEEAAALERRTEGWIAGLQLAALAMRGRDDRTAFIDQFTGSNRFVVDYLAEEVFENRPRHVQSFLLQTSILDRLCGPLCDAVLLGNGTTAEREARAYSQPILEELERDNLFIVPLDDDRRWYRYHQLFGEVLRNRLVHGAGAEEVATLYRRASVWYEQQGTIDEAVRYALAAVDMERAALLIERHAVAIMLASSNVFMVRAWIEQLPRALVLARPRLVFAAATTLILTGRIAAVDQLLDDAAPTLERAEQSPDIAGEVAVLRSTMARFAHNADANLAFARQALDTLAADNYPARAVAAINSGVALLALSEPEAARAAFARAVAYAERSGSWWIALGALEELGSLLSRQGRLGEALATFEQAVQLAAGLGGQRMPAAGLGQVGVAEIKYELNDLTGATRAAQLGLELLGGSVERGLLARGYIALARSQQAQGDGDAALQSIRRCDAWFARSQLAAPAELAWLDAYRARLLLAQGKPAAASEWADGLEVSGRLELALVQRLTLARLLLAQRREAGAGSLAEAQQQLDLALEIAREQRWTRYQIEACLLQALVQRENGKPGAAARLLAEALGQAREQGYVRSFVDEGAPMAELLALVSGDAAVEPAVAGYASVLLAAQGGRTTVVAATSNGDDGQVARADQALQESPLIEGLTERELEVLRLVAGGLSNQAIADRLVVAVSTVKKHLNNIYGKLETESRTQAIARARELKLL